MYLSSLGTTSLYTKGLYHLINVLIDKANVCIREKS